MDAEVAAIVTVNYAESDTRKLKTHVLPRIKEIEQWIKEGYTDYSIADNLGITPGTLITYKKNSIEVIEAYTRARTHKNCLVMNSMYRKANGEKASVIKQKLDKFGQIHDLREEVYIPADVNAADLYLRNNSEDYKSAKQDTSGNTIILNNYQLPQLTERLNSIQAEREKLERLMAVEVECIDAGDR